MSKQFQTDAEIAALADIDKQIAAGGDPFGDDEPLVAPSIADSAAAAQALIDEDAGVAEGVETAASEVMEPEAADTATVADEKLVEPSTESLSPPPPNIDPVALNTDRAKLMAERATGLKEMMDGVLSPEDYATADAERQGKLDHLLSQRVRLETYAEARGNEQQAAVADLMAQSAKAGAAVNYNTDPTAPAQFDMAFQMLLADPANARRPHANVVADAHRVVLALRGVKAPAPAAAAPTAAVARVPEKGPVTLRNVPAAAVPNTAGDLGAVLGRLKGAEYEAAFAKLTTAQKAALVDD